MSQPQFVPTAPQRSTYYTSPPKRDRSWSADRPGDVFQHGQPTGELLGAQGPDQGFALKLVRNFEPELCLTPGEHLADVNAGCVAVALKRASAFGRAPTVHDLRCAFSIFGFLDPSADAALVALRKNLFEEVAHAHHYAERRAIADAVPTEFLRRPHARVIEDSASWRSVLARVLD